MFGIFGILLLITGPLTILFVFLCKRFKITRFWPATFAGLIFYCLIAVIFMGVLTTAGGYNPHDIWYEIIFKSLILSAFGVVMFSPLYLPYILLLAKYISKKYGEKNY